MRVLAPPKRWVLVVLSCIAVALSIPSASARKYSKKNSIFGLDIRQLQRKCEEVSENVFGELKHIREELSENDIHNVYAAVGAAGVALTAGKPKSKNRIEILKQSCEEISESGKEGASALFTGLKQSCEGLTESGKQGASALVTGLKDDWENLSESGRKLSEIGRAKTSALVEGLEQNGENLLESGKKVTNALAAGLKQSCDDLSENLSYCCGKLSESGRVKTSAFVGGLEQNCENLLESGKKGTSALVAGLKQTCENLSESGKQGTSTLVAVLNESGTKISESGKQGAGALVAVLKQNCESLSERGRELSESGKQRTSALVAALRQSCESLSKSGKNASVGAGAAWEEFKQNYKNLSDNERLGTYAATSFVGTKVAVKSIQTFPGVAKLAGGAWIASEALEAAGVLKNIPDVSRARKISPVERLKWGALANVKGYRDNIRFVLSPESVDTVFGTTKSKVDERAAMKALAAGIYCGLWRFW